MGKKQSAMKRNENSKTAEVKQRLGTTNLQKKRKKSALSMPKKLVSVKIQVAVQYTSEWFFEGRINDKISRAKERIVNLSLNSLPYIF